MNHQGASSIAHASGETGGSIQTRMKGNKDELDEMDEDGKIEEKHFV